MAGRIIASAPTTACPLLIYESALVHRVLPTSRASRPASPIVGWPAASMRTTIESSNLTTRMDRDAEAGHQANGLAQPPSDLHKRSLTQCRRDGALQPFLQADEHLIAEVFPGRCDVGH
jgi:hypothetical protein